MKNTKKSFFSKVKQAICKFEDYIEFATEKTSTAIIYFVKLMIVFSLLVSIAFTYKFTKIMNNTIEYLENNIPDFSIVDGKLIIETDKPIIVEDDEKSYAIIINTHDNTITDISYDAGILFLEEELKIKAPPSNESISYKYEDILKQYGINEEITKQTIIEYISNINKTTLYSAIYIVTAIYIFFIYFIVIFMDIIMLSIFGYIATGISRVTLKYKPIFNMSVYAMTLSIILNILYIIINLLTGFTIKYFQFMYNAIAYIYLITAILMIKSDLIKQHIELMRIIEEQKNIQNEENNNEEEKQEDTEKEENKEDKKEEPEQNQTDQPTPEGT